MDFDHSGFQLFNLEINQSKSDLCFGHFYYNSVCFSVLFWKFPVKMDTSSLDSRFSSILPRVEFIDIQDQYSYNEDLVCRYTLIDYEVQEGDRIAIFKLGWQYVKDYVLFEWVPKDSDENFVTFNKLCLPKSTIEIYQFSFISGENNVHGASEPFQFCDRPKNYQSLFMNSSYKKDVSLPENYKSLTNNSPLTSLSIGDAIEIDKDKEIMRMKEENEFLRNTLKIIVMQNKTKNYDPDIQKLKKMTCDLQANLNIQQSQIKDLQVKVAEGNEQYRKLNKEKMELENTCDDLRKKLDKEVSIGQTAADYEIGELESIPPFPFAK